MRLYDHDRVRELPKPWLTTPSVMEIKNRVTSDKFEWPRKASLADFRAMIRRGNHRPSPGPDRWEKWAIKSLSDSALSLVLDLHNYEVMNSLAAQPGVQTRDLMSYLAGIKCWANRHKQPIYAIKRDQMKGFDYLSPDGFRDSILAYGLPQAIIDLDKAAQSQVRCFIHTAYGATEPIITSGVNKQGGPASQLKSTFTTSMGHYYLCDRLKKDKDAVIVTSSSNERKDPHLKDAERELLVAMVEATDDTYIFSRSAESLVQHTLAMERFQYAYGWQTQWAKSNAYIIAPRNDKTYPNTITFQSVTIGGREVNPLAITEHTIALIKNDLDFLRAKVDDPSARFKELENFIETYQFPTVIGRLPITLVRKIISQNIVAKCRALLSLQPIMPADAEKLDRLIVGKVHKILGFPFHPNTNIATLPTAQHGLGFPSIARINAGLAVDGLQRDLNHHIPAYRAMALITRTDWICEKNQCLDPLDGIGLQKNYTRQLKSIPAGWITAQHTMHNLSLSLRETDQSHITKGDVSLSHAVQVYNHKITPIDPSRKINKITLGTLRRMKINTVHDLGKWIIDDDGTIALQSRQVTFDRTWTQAARKNWNFVANALHQNLHLDDLINGPVDLAIPRLTRQTRAENQIQGLVTSCGFQPSRETDGKTWASDGSMIPASASMMDDKTITGAATGTKSLVMRIPGRNVSILHGEQLGLIIALVLSQNSEISNANEEHCRLLTDHLNSVRLIEDSQTEISQIPRLRYMNGRSYYRWILSLAERSPLKIQYTPGHSKDGTLETRMNNEADHLASSSQKTFRQLPTAPIPTFFMNTFTFHHKTDGWIESNIPHYVDSLLVRKTQASLQHECSQRMSTWAHDKTPPPDYPYLKATSAHSAAVQLYARSGQLATADILRRRNKIESDQCRLGCEATESARHLFVNCCHYQPWRKEAAKHLVDTTKLKAETIGCDETTKQNLISAAKSLLSDDPKIWPLHYSLYYLGQIPTIDQLITDPNMNHIHQRRLISHIAADWHLSSIRLAGRIFGDFQKRMAVRNECPKRRP
ncbi:hypothetical protein GALMADRAFT_119768 [Galerina marginata CBS 339.88]|uniref:Uncharacterized protein n=1 Tax=Galerina marginata (strain CBS 339.88) TaxID=685588 RepID=A0A067TF97_GALM3|nr:hypothetical protein GALMADRAFT_119768 [Galerina marginata CBS 339.88]